LFYLFALHLVVDLLLDELPHLCDLRLLLAHLLSERQIHVFFNVRHLPFFVRVKDPEFARYSKRFQHLSPADSDFVADPPLLNLEVRHICEIDTTVVLRWRVLPIVVLSSVIYGELLRVDNIGISVRRLVLIDHDVHV